LAGAEVDYKNKKGKEEEKIGPRRNKEILCFIDCNKLASLDKRPQKEKGNSPKTLIRSSGLSKTFWCEKNYGRKRR